VELAKRRGIHGLLDDAYEQLERANGDSISHWVYRELLEREEPSEAVAIAVPALVAIVADPQTSSRSGLARVLVRLAIVALGEHEGAIASPDVIDAFRSMLSVLLSLQDASKALLHTCSLMVSAVGFADAEPAWLHAARELPEFRRYVARADLYTEILEDNY
jgi:hypothetical protein